MIAGVEKLRFFPLEVVSGHASTLEEPGGRELLDLSATWTATGLGHGHPAVIEAASRVIASAPGASVLSAIHPEAVELAEELLALDPGAGERRVYLGYAGSDANDVALRCCRYYNGRPTILAFEGSYHGGIGLAMGVSGQLIDAGQEADADAVFLPHPNPLRPLTGDIESTVAHILALTERHLLTDRIASLIVEPILSDGGLVVPPAGFLAALHRLCVASGVPMIFLGGHGRTGHLHAYSVDGFEPEIVTFGKALGAGLPISAAVGPAAILDAPASSALLTVAGNAVCSAAARAVLRTVVNEGLPARAAIAGARLIDGLQSVADGNGCHDGLAATRIGEVRGRGLNTGVQLVSDRETLLPDHDLAQQVVYRAWQLGCVLYYVGGNVLEITPALIITDTEIDRAIDILDRAIAEAIDGAVSDADIAPLAGWQR